MFITRQNAKGGPRLKICPIDVDERTGNFGYRIGYCSGCNEPLMIRTVELREVLEYFGVSGSEKLKHESLRERIVHILGGEILEK